MTNPHSRVFQKLSKKYNTPEKVQKYISSLKYNKKPTMRSALSTWRHKEAHCMEGAFLAAAILEPLGYPPLILSFESIDLLEHVIFIYKKKNLWGAIGCSRDQGLKGRKPIFKTIRALTLSYFEPYIDKTGLITAYQQANLDETTGDWRYSKRNVWKSENYLLNLPHIRLKSSKKRSRQIRDRYLKNGPMKPKPFWVY
ncbi:MAG: hypothetical protein JNM24_12560 [Bdellovibrionaceae bacterium]|nr:hypothetical protein [Pseudobdellovibrionaceae bacterium]